MYKILFLNLLTILCLLALAAFPYAVFIEQVSSRILKLRCIPKQFIKSICISDK